jgi:hypothetical protein
LWFLYVLLGLYTAALVARVLVSAIDAHLPLRRAVDRTVRVLLDTWLAPVALAAPTAAALYLHRDWLLWLGVPTPDHGFVPSAPALAAYSVAFGFGWVLHRQTNLLSLFERRWLPHLAAAVVLTGLCMWISGVTVILDSSAQWTATNDIFRTIAAIAYPLATWAWSFGLIGLAMRYLSQPSASVRYTADASYWVYLVHLPLLMAAQVILFPLQAPALVKFALVLVTTCPLMFGSYHLMVRYTFIGAILNGKRHPRASKGETLPRAA